MKNMKQMMTCPACGEVSKDKWNDVKSCHRCGGLFGTAPNAESVRHLVEFRWSEIEGSPEDWQYVSILFEDTGRRWHGWVHRRTRRIVQVG